MFRKALIAGCTIAMFSMGGLGTVDTAEASLRGVARSISRNINRQQRDFERNLNRNIRNQSRDFRRARNNNFHGNNFNQRGFYGAPGFHGGNRGFISTPYFSIGF